MKKREPTPEELALWRHVTQHDVPQSTLRSSETPAAATPEKPLPTVSMPVPTVPRPRSSPALPALAPTDWRQFKKLQGPHKAIEAQLDFHGLTQTQAYQRVGEFLRDAQQQGLRHVTIITGKGRNGEGILRTRLPHWLNEPHLRALVGGFGYPTLRDGGEGAMHVLVKQRRSMHEPDSGKTHPRGR